MARPPLSVRVVSPDRIVFEGEASALVAPAWDGLVGILPGHASMLTLLGAGTVRAERPRGGTDSFRVEGGIIKIDDGKVTILTERADQAEGEKRVAEAVFFDDDG